MYLKQFGRGNFEELANRKVHGKREGQIWVYEKRAGGFWGLPSNISKETPGAT